MKFSLTQKFLFSVPADLSVVFSFDVNSLDAENGKRIEEVIRSERFEDKVGNTLLIRTEDRKLLVVGLGKLEELEMVDWQTALAGVSRKVKEVHAKTVTISFPIKELNKIHISPENLVKGAVEGLELGAYEFTKHKKKENVSVIDKVTFVVEPQYDKEVKKGIAIGQITSKATLFARDLVNEPSSVTTPTFLSLIAQSLAKESPDITCEVMGEKEIKKLGMGGLIGISKGSDEDPKFIVFSYKGKTEKTIVLVGKGVTFDSGGLSLKPDKSMETMKLDMAGAASVLGIFSALPKLKPSVNVIGLLPLCENMPSGSAVKPGDILTSYNGKTIEIISTDAEGRVILADALSYAHKFHPDVIIDLATLTGACSIALGEEIAGLFANEKILADQLLAAGKETGERLWELPLAKEYEELLKSPVADIKNVAKTRAGGAITGALFLKPFVPENVQWAHIDIGGTAWEEKSTPLMGEGGTGWGVRLILSFLTK